MAKKKKEEQIRVEIQEQYAPLLSMPKVRYKLYYGGRAGGKSYGFADALLVLARQGKLLIACVREVQNSIKDSVYKLLKDRAEYWGFEDYRFYEDRIENILTGSRFIFKGLQDNNAQNIKSLEGVDICWIEEGQSISKKSWEILDPTIRKPGAQIWISMNRELENDPIFQRTKTRKPGTNFMPNLDGRKQPTSTTSALMTTIRRKFRNLCLKPIRPQNRLKRWLPVLTN